MHSIAWFILGFLLGWLLQWGLSYFYFRRRRDRRAPQSRSTTDSYSGEAPIPVAEMEPVTNRNPEEDAAGFPVASVVDPAPAQPVPATVMPSSAHTFRQESVSIPPQATETTAPSDDLTLVRGIGRMYARYLQQVGVLTFDQLAAQGPEALVAVLRAQGIKGIGVKRVSNWINEARSLTQATGQAVLGDNDLTLIHGIDNVYALRLRRAGIDTFRALAQATPAQLETAVTPQPWVQVNFAGWIRQAKALAGLQPPIESVEDR